MACLSFLPVGILGALSGLEPLVGGPTKHNGHEVNIPTTGRASAIDIVEDADNVIEIQFENPQIVEECDKALKSFATENAPELKRA